MSENIQQNLNLVNSQINETAAKNNVRLVAVSKTKPVSDIEAAYKVGHRVFGENYIKELVEKSEVLKDRTDIKWHFIGNLQKKGCSKLSTCKNLSVVETVDSQKVATALSNGWSRNGGGTKLKIFIQINTSREEQKSGCMPESALELADFIVSNCGSLDFAGVMTIGQFGYDWSKGDNPDFIELLKCHQSLSKHFNRTDLEISMGMSDDFLNAINMGSTNVRVGSKIFGARAYANKQG